MADLELVRKLPDDWGKGFAELYKRGGEYIVVSTINLSADRYDSGERAIVSMVGMLGGYATAGEETMAFRSDEAGEIDDWSELATSTGEGSRDEVLKELKG